MARKLTYDDISDLHRHGKFTELIRGVFYNHPSPSTAHQKVVSNIDRYLGSWFERRKLGRVFIAPCDVIMSPGDVVQPDVVFISKSKVRHIEERGFQGVPSFAVEVISKSDENYDRVTKKSVYASYGMRHLWYADPEKKTLEVLELVGRRYVLRGVYDTKAAFSHRLLPGLVIRVKRIFGGI